jgi:hypothetical protein
MNRLFLIVLCAVAFAPLSAFADDDEGQWGNVRGQFVYDGPVPEVKMLPIVRDRAALGDEIADESLVVSEENKGIANVVVYLVPDADAELRVHPSYDEAAKAKVELAMEGSRFAPRVVLLRTSQTLVMRNKDMVAHAVRAHFQNNPNFTLLIPRVSLKERNLTKEDSLPSIATCPIHPWERGYIVVRANPYMAVSDENGEFEIRNLPAGKHVFRIWHERVGWLREVQIGMHKTDDKGRLTVTIDPGENDLHSAEIPPKLFEKDKQDK